MNTDDPAAARVDAPRPDGGRAGRNLPAAIIVGLVLVAAIASTLMWWRFGFVLLVAAALCLGAHEIHRALSRLGMRAAIIPIWAGTLIIVIGSYYAGVRPRVVEAGIVAPLPSNSLLLAGLGATIVAALVWRMPGGPQGYARDAAASLFIISYVSLLGSFVTLMLAGELGSARVITFILAVAASDIGGYFAGVVFGRHKMAPVISPKKTWEGFVGSLLLSMAVGATLSVLMLHSHWWVGALIGVVSTSVGTAGDLVESMIKRDIGIKDMSSSLPGHGGIMDRIDSLLVAAPAVWLVMYLLVPGG